ncbi:uncharacterized protein BXZ73DRAFT_100131 [Epithele typhae]|uniref:uncharacterized protein n=1 Tax=Epithele typhae TaxID=378194 RepID=UPI00200749E5|nr:uncharacterized protein BXZ73DRAFT_100131 [Epithele typhae]KAH9937916.1 hypothetical protein BXZ73DRAFT_100131 [Epithele typhae]
MSRADNPSDLPVLYVKWTHQSSIPSLALSTLTPTPASSLVYHYLAPICPAAPLALGQHLKLLVLSDPRFHTPAEDLPPPTGSHQYDSYDPHIEGPLVAARDMSDRALVLVLRNTCAWNPVVYAYVTVPNLPGLTVHPDVRDRARSVPPSACTSAMGPAVSLEEGVTILSHGSPQRARPPASPYFEYEDPDDIISAMKRSVGLGGRYGRAKRPRSNSR